MKNKRNKKKVISIVALVASFVLCIGATFGITMAYFGGTDSKSLSNITLKTGIVIGASISADSSVQNSLVVPSQPVTVTATGSVTAATDNGASAVNAVKGLVRAKFSVAGEGTFASGFTVTTDGETDDWYKDGDYYYLVSSGTTLKEVTAGGSVTISGKFTVPSTLNNSNSGQAVSITVTFEVVQSELWDASGNKVEKTVNTDVKSAFDALTA